MALYSYLENTGTILPDTGALRDEIEAEYRENFGHDLILTPESPEGVLVTAETEARDAVLRLNAALANQINPNLAGGIFLDAICALTGLERDKAEHTLVKALLRGEPETNIPKGTEAQTEEGDKFVSLAAAKLNGAGRVEVFFKSREAGAVPCPVGALKKIPRGILGWETITNAAPGTLGKPVESDFLLRRKRRQTLYLQGVALPGAIQSALYNVEGVTSLVYRENYTSVPQEIDGKTLKPHSIYVCVDGGTDADIARALFDNKSLGCGYTGQDVEMMVTEHISGKEYPVVFDRPELVPVRCVVTVKKLNSTVLDVQSVCKQAILAYAAGDLQGALEVLDGTPENAPSMEGFTVGAGVSPFELAASVAVFAPSLFVVDVRVGLLATLDAGLKPETLPLALWEKATITDGSIRVIGG